MKKADMLACPQCGEKTFTLATYEVVGERPGVGPLICATCGFAAELTPKPVKVRWND